MITSPGVFFKKVKKQQQEEADPKGRKDLTFYTISFPKLLASVRKQQQESILYTFFLPGLITVKERADFC